ncbi:MAG TPA: TonB-dependent receptor [Syntrophaceae bacterium]|nr:TonB-dependent receptor [Syntrophaceae bacterium]HCX01460.1 TonB-dependent receptor [Syntrophaceae bacterium]
MAWMAGLALGPSAAWAADEEKAVPLEDIVVTATRTEKELSSAPGSVSVVTKKAIEKRSINSIDEALNTTAGVVANRAGVRDTMSSMTLGGIPGQSRTLVLIDGIPVNSPYSGGIDLTGVAVNDVEKIEVVKGPFSSLYGGSAMGGVVSIFTKMPEKREFTVKSGYGSGWSREKAEKDLITFYASGGDKIYDKLRLFLSYDYKHTNGYPTSLNVQSSQPTAGVTGWSQTTSNTGATRYLIGHKGDDAWHNDNIAFKASYDFTPATKARFQFLRATFDYCTEGPETYLQNAVGAEVWSYGSVKEGSFLSGAGGSVRNIYNFGFETELFERAKVKLALGYFDQAKRWYVTPTSASATRAGGTGKLSDSPTSSYNADLQVTLPAFSRQVLTFGGAYKVGWSDSQENNVTNWLDESTKTDLTYQAKGRDRTFAVFVQDEIRILEKLTAYIGARQDWWETYDGYVQQTGSAGYPKNYDRRSASSFSPKGALVYKPFEQTVLRASVGQAFRSPTLYDLYRTWTTTGGVTYNSNPDLKPETSTSWNAGVDQGMWKGASVAALYFENYIKDMIYTKTVSSTQKDKVNAGKGQSRGVELAAQQKFDIGLRLFTNFTYTDSSITENDANPASVGKDMVDIPRVMFNAGCDFERGPVSVSLQGRYMGKRYGNDDNTDTASNVYGAYDDFFTADAKVSYKPISWAEASFSVSNLLDREYYSSSPAPGRSWFLSLTLKY